MLRSARAILENRLEALQGRRHDLDVRISSAEDRLALEKHRYDTLALHWQQVGAEMVLSDADRHKATLQRWRGFSRGFAMGLLLPAVLGLLLLFAG